MADTPLEESNLAYIGSDEDKAAREAAAQLEVHWEGCGQEVGVEVWRVENMRANDDVAADFGINVWPKDRYGEFYTGDSYIVLKTSKSAEDDSLEWDIFFWIGAESSQDEYGVAAYKANELDDLLGTAPVQHRELQGYETAEFLKCFNRVTYLEGGMESGFRQVGADSGTVGEMPTRLYQIRKVPSVGKIPISKALPVAASSLNTGDAFVLVTTDVIYTWYGDECSPFEKNKAVEIATALQSARHGHGDLVVDVGNDEEAFFSALGGGSIDDVAPAESVTDDVEEMPSKMYILQDEDSQLKVIQVEASTDKLDPTGVCMVDVGTDIIIWIGKEASSREQSQAMSMVGTYLKSMGRQSNTRVARILQGQEGRAGSVWNKAFA